MPLWILGSSNFGAMLAAELGLPYAFASHFAPELLISALQIYRSRFKPSEQLDRPLRHGGRQHHRELMIVSMSMTMQLGCAPSNLSPT
jgi:hypothetical protein